MDLNTYLDPTLIWQLQAGGYMIMLVLMIIEGPIVTFIAAFLASLWVFDIWLVFLFGWMGDVLWDLLFYSIWRYGFQIFKKQTTSTKVGSGFIGKLDYLIDRNLALAILIIKFTPYAPPVGLTYLGKLAIPIKKYILYSALLCVPIPLVSGAIGYHLGIMNALLHKYTWVTLLLYISLSLSIIAVAVLIVFFLRKKTSSILKAGNPTVQKTEKSTTSVE